VCGSRQLARRIVRITAQFAATMMAAALSLAETRVASVIGLAARKGGVASDFSHGLALPRFPPIKPARKGGAPRPITSGKTDPGIIHPLT